MTILRVNNNIILRIEFDEKIHGMQHVTHNIILTLLAYLIHHYINVESYDNNIIYNIRNYINI